MTQWLESEGASRAILLFIMVFIAVVASIMHLTHHDPAQVGITVESNTFTAAFTLLIKKLS